MNTYSSDCAHKIAISRVLVRAPLLFEQVRPFTHAAVTTVESDALISAWTEFLQPNIQTRTQEVISISMANRKSLRSDRIAPRSETKLGTKLNYVEEYFNLLP